MRRVATTAFLATGLFAACGGAPPPGPAPEATGVRAPVGAAAPATSGARPPARAPEATDVGASVGAAATATIGASGGQLRSPDGKFTINVPAGALAANTSLTIQPITNTAHGGRGAAYLLGPDGQAFQRPVTLTFAYTDEDVSGTAPEALAIAFQTGERYWQLADTTCDAAAKTLTVRTTHLSAWSLVTRLRLAPATAKVGVGKSLTLAMEYCFPIDDRAVAQGVGPSGFSCRAIGTSMGFLFKEWAVNGLPGGDPLVGTIAPDFNRARYTAPAVRPQPTTVTVSVNYTHDIEYPFKSAITVVDVPQQLNGTYVLDYSLQAPEYVESFHITGTFVCSKPAGGPNVYTYRTGTRDVTGTMTNYVRDHTLHRCTSRGGPLGPSSASLALSFDPTGSYVGGNLKGRYPVACNSKTGNPPYTSNVSLDAQFGVGMVNDKACERLYAAASTTARDGIPFPDSVSGHAHYTCNATGGRKTVTMSWTAAAQ